MCLYAIVGACALGVNSHMAVHDASHYNPSGVPRYLAAHYISPPIQVGEAVRSAINTQAPWSGRAGPRDRYKPGKLRHARHVSRAGTRKLRILAIAIA